jgi:molecular chaperone GrpE
VNSNVEEENNLSDNLQQEHTEEELQNEAEAANVEDVTGEIEKLRLEAEEHQQRLLRVQADYDNFRRRTVKEKEELAKYASSVLITQLIPVIDNFERALTTGDESTNGSAYAKGVEMIFRQFMDVMSAEGLTPMNSVGEAFNPEYHQAIMQVESDEYEEGIVVEEIQKGYLLKDKVLRPAMVKVSQ